MLPMRPFWTVKQAVWSVSARGSTFQRPVAQIVYSVCTTHTLKSASREKRPIFCSDFMPPKRRFWKELQKMKSALPILSSLPQSSFGDHIFITFSGLFLPKSLLLLLSAVAWPFLANQRRPLRAFRDHVSDCDT